MNLFVLGFFIILNALAFAIYWVTGNNPHKVWIIPVCTVAIIVGIFFTLYDRAIEITFKGIGTIKAAAKQAVIDAETISDLKKRIENQSATIDLVAQKATEAHKTILELEKITEFYKIEAAAQNDDRKAFDKLASLVDNKSSDLWELAANAAIKIRTTYGGAIEPGYMNVEWKEGTDPTKLSIEQIRNDYLKSLSLFHAYFVNLVWKNKVISKKERMEFFVDILKDDGSLTATFYAGKFFVKLSEDPELKWSPFSTKPLLDWWEKNRDNIK